MKLSTHLYEIKKGFDKSIDESFDSEQTVFFIFGSSEFKNNIQIFNDLKKRFPKSTFIGCSTSGEIFGNRVYDDTLSIAVAQFSNTKVKIVNLPIESMSKSFEIGQNLADQFPKENLSGIFLLSDGLQINGSELVNGINSKLDSKIIVTGGLAGDGSDFKSTWILKDKLPASGYISAVGFYGSYINLSHGTQGGWDIFGLERIVTKSEDNILYELDGKPALSLYKEYLGEKAQGLPATALLFPLQIRDNKDDEKRVVRTILSIDENKQALVFAGNIPEGSLAQLMRANFDSLIEGASQAAQLINHLTPGPHLALAISCVGRRLVLGERLRRKLRLL